MWKEPVTFSRALAPKMTPLGLINQRFVPAANPATPEATASSPSMLDCWAPVTRLTIFETEAWGVVVLRVNVALPPVGTLNWPKLKKRFGLLSRPAAEGMVKLSGPPSPGAPGGAVASSVIWARHTLGSSTRPTSSVADRKRGPATRLSGPVQAIGSLRPAVGPPPDAGTRPMHAARPTGRQEDTTLRRVPGASDEAPGFPPAAATGGS